MIFLDSPTAPLTRQGTGPAVVYAYSAVGFLILIKKGKVKMKILLDEPKPKFQRFGKLPGRPSALIRLALDDLIKCEKSPFYNVEMCDWHDGLYSAPGQCDVCFAGSVMAQTLNADKTKIFFPADYNGGAEWALHALNDFRIGHIGDGLRALRLHSGRFVKIMQIASYYLDPKLFKRQMRAMATAFEKAGY